MLWKAFARLSAVYGGTYMLNKPECKVTKVFQPAHNMRILKQNGSSKLLTTVPNLLTFCRLSLMRVEKHMESLPKGRPQNARRLFVILHICLKRYIYVENWWVTCTWLQFLKCLNQWAGEEGWKGGPCDMYYEASNPRHQGFTLRADHPPKEAVKAQIRHVSHLVQVVQQILKKL